MLPLWDKPPLLTAPAVYGFCCSVYGFQQAMGAALVVLLSMGGVAQSMGLLRRCRYGSQEGTAKLQKGGVAPMGQPLADQASSMGSAADAPSLVQHSHG